MNWWQAVGTILLGNLIVLVPLWSTPNAVAYRTSNVEACKRGLPTCDPSLLTGPEMASVVAYFQQRRSRSVRPRQETRQ
jgi:hypothetical protein